LVHGSSHPPQRAAPEARAPTPKPQIPPPSDDSLTVSEFCALEKISRRTFDGLRARDEGPRFFLIGKQIRITREAREAWRAKRERLAKAGA
jgi:hypothetical protein